MTRFLAVALGTVCLCLAVAGPLRAQDFDAGWAAYMDENYPAALKHWRPLAEGGHARAQILLASMYATGAGVPRDPATAAAWLRRAADRSGRCSWPVRPGPRLWQGRGRRQGPGGGLFLVRPGRRPGSRPRRRGARRPGQAPARRPPRRHRRPRQGLAPRTREPEIARWHGMRGARRARRFCAGRRLR